MQGVFATRSLGGEEWLMVRVAGLVVWGVAETERVWRGVLIRRAHTRR